MSSHFFTCPFCQRLADQAEAFFNEGQPFCSDECRTADFRRRNMIYIELPEKELDLCPIQRHQLGEEKDGDSSEQPNDLLARTTRGNQYE